MNRLVALILVVVLLLVSIPAAAAQPIPASPWYAVVYQPETNLLQWINAAGVQGTSPRPQIPAEASFIDMRISPNGRTMVQVSQLINGSQGLGVYDIATGTFVALHEAQPGETIFLGGENIFTANSQNFAVGFFSGDFGAPQWRVILFDAQTGAVVAFIDHTHPDAPDVQLSAPAVQVIDGMYVHFQMIPQAVGGWHTWPAYAWRFGGFDPASPMIVESPYSRADVQVELLTGRVAMTYLDQNFGIPPQDGLTPNFNAVGTGILANNPNLTPIHADSTRYHLSTRWANGGNWVLFNSTDTLQNDYWSIVLANGAPGNNSHLPLDPQFEEAFGTSDGYLLRNNANMLFFSNGFNPNTAPSIAMLSPNSRVVYVTPIGVNFALDQLPGNQAPVIQPPQNPVVVAQPPAPVIETPVPPVAPPVVLDCSLALPQRVGVGSTARVVPAMGALNVRQVPNGAVVTQFAGGDSFAIIAGPMCENGMYWWQIQRDAVAGWLAEAGSDGYYIEPFVEPPAPPPQPPPQQPGLNEGAPTEPGCQNAPPSRLSLGGTATVIVGGSLLMYDAPGGESTRYRLPSGASVTIIAGADCAGGQRWWLVFGEAQRGHIGRNLEPVQYWVSEGVDGTYYLAP